MTKTIETIIVGAGISGLACAKRLQEYDKEFVVISKDIGGRVLTSSDGRVNYGAFFICSDYDNVLPYVTIQSRIRLRDFCFHEKEITYGLFEPQLLGYTFQFMKILKFLFRFRKALRRFRKTSETFSQKQAIEQDPFLYQLYMTNAYDFVKEQELQTGTEKYLAKALYSTTFSSISKMNAFSFLQFLLPLITPIYSFTFEKEKMIESFQDKIVISRVSDVRYRNKKYHVKANGKTYSSCNIVLATPITWSHRYTGVQSFNIPVSTNMVHINGKPKEHIAGKKYHLFPPSSSTQAIADLEDSTYLFYYTSARPLLKDYFFNPQVLGRHFWDPAGTINGHVLIESNRGNNMYLIGDCNIAGLEESYITGIYSANQIVQSSSLQES